MEMNVDKSDYVNASEKRRDRKRTTVTPRSGRKVHRLVVLTLGLLCVLQATLNISLRLIFSDADCQTDQKSSYNILTEESDQLQARSNNLTEERDQLQEERDQLKKDIEGLNERIRMLEGWREFGGSWYNYNFNERKTWEESRQDCVSRGADLVVINSREEQIFIHRLIGSPSRAEPWIGLTDRGREGTWTWVDGTPLTTSYWEIGRPDGQNGTGHNGTDQDCVEFWSRPTGQPVWNDDACFVENEWICEK